MTKEVVNIELRKFVQSHIIVVARVDFVCDVCSTFFGGHMDDNVTEQSCTYSGQKNRYNVLEV